jgi:hypothetical protein
VKRRPIDEYQCDERLKVGSGTGLYVEYAKKSVRHLLKKGAFFSIKQSFLDTFSSEFF